MIETEILVVGGGPAGVISAITGAKAGRQVTLIDAKTHDEIGNKVCGDALDLGPVKFLEEKLGIEKPHGEEVADTVERLIFRTPRVDFPLIGDGYVLNRHPYGQRLLKKAEEYGTTVISQTKVKSAIVENGSVQGVIVKDRITKEEYEIRAKITIDCSGRNYQVRKTIPQSQFPYLEKEMDRRDIAGSYREIITTKEDNPYRHEIYLIYEDTIPEPGYFWIFSKGEKRLNCGIGWFMDTKAERGMKSHYREVLHKYYPPGSYELEHTGGYWIPTRYPMTNAVAPGFMAAGDAAFHVNPLSAEGHGPALVAGYYAGTAAAKAIEKGDVSEEALWEYNINIMRHFGLSHTKIQLFTAALRRIKVRGLEFFLKRKILDQDQFVNLHGGKKLNKLEMLWIAIKAFPRYLILWELRKISKGVQFFENLFARYPTHPSGYPAWYAEFEKNMNKARFQDSESAEV
ncbi:MAG: NAD(P)/FAD-dependent oxidoreductase [Candidatus Thorarchaeota archaeon]